MLTYIAEVNKEVKLATAGQKKKQGSHGAEGTSSPV